MTVEDGWWVVAFKGDVRPHKRMCGEVHTTGDGRWFAVQEHRYTLGESRELFTFIRRLDLEWEPPTFEEMGLYADDVATYMMRVSRFGHGNGAQTSRPSVWLAAHRASKASE